MRRFAMGCAAAYAEALHELEAAFAMRQPPRLLYGLATVHRKLGHAAEALGYYQRYPVAEANPDPAVVAEVQGAIAQLKPLVAPPPPAPPPLRLAPQPASFRTETRADRGLIGGGAGLLGAGYGLGVITGSLVLSFATGDFRVAGGLLLVPVLGPFIAAFVFLEPTWSILNIVIGGGMQVGGLAMIIVGAKRKVKVVSAWQTLNLAPMNLRGGGGLVVAGRF